MRKRIQKIRHSLVLKIILSVTTVLLLAFAAWALFNIDQYEKKVMADIVGDCNQLGEAVRLGTHYAMMFNARADINQIINNMSRLEGIEHIRIYNKQGQIRFSNLPAEVGQVTGIKAEACDICHRTEPPLDILGLEKRQRTFAATQGHRLLGVISPIYNEPGCATAACHAHPEGKKVLGALDVVISLKETDGELLAYKRGLTLLAVAVFLTTSAVILLVLSRFFIAPIKHLIRGTRRIAKGEYGALEFFEKQDEIGHLATAIHSMGIDISKKQQEVNKQKDQYQRLFELVPCIISVQDRNYKLIGFNQEFSKRFAPRPGEYCYSAYKGRDKKCRFCPVEKTFQDGLPHYSEETGRNKDGSLTHWIVKTAPLKNDNGDIIGAMEMSLDITHKKELEDRLARSEKKYYAIFNNIPNPVFVLDTDTLIILDCNESVSVVYGYAKEELQDKSFLDLFWEDDPEKHAAMLKSSREVNRVRHRGKHGNTLYVNIRMSPSEYSSRPVLLATTSDITKRLEAEMQLIQAGKMATLGEMATGVAHELNQPLSVIKTASNFFMKKIRKKETINDEILLTMAAEIDSHVDRASQIINHMREFGRKADMALEPVDISTVLEKAFAIFSQQLKLRQIRVEWDLEDDLPPVKAEAGRLEQVFINLLINARDAIEERWGQGVPDPGSEKSIRLTTRRRQDDIVVEVADSGVGIPEPLANKIFEPFFTTKKVGDGTGLGLSISYGIIQEFGGSIQVTSTPDQGACFIVRLPLMTDA
jgi:histidine kinase